MCNAACAGASGRLQLRRMQLQESSSKLIMTADRHTAHLKVGCAACMRGLAPQLLQLLLRWQSGQLDSCVHALSLHRSPVSLPAAAT